MDIDIRLVNEVSLDTKGLGSIKVQQATGEIKIFTEINIDQFIFDINARYSLIFANKTIFLNPNAVAYIQHPKYCP